RYARGVETSLAAAREPRPGEQPARLAEVMLNRDLSWLEFNWRGLHEALGERAPPLARGEVLALFAPHLDAVLMTRLRSRRPASDDATAAAEERRELLLRVRGRPLELLDEQARCYAATLRPRLARHGIRLACWTDLTDEQREHAGAYFDSDVSP